MQMHAHRIAMSAAAVARGLPVRVCVAVAIALTLHGAAHADSIPVLKAVQWEGGLDAPARAALDEAIHAELGKSIDKVGAAELANRMTTILRGAGYPVAAVLLTGDDWNRFTDGRLPLHVFEGDVGAVRVASNSSQVADSRLRLTAARALCGRSGPPCPLSETKLERAALLLQDLPGVKLKPVTLSPKGVGVGQTAVEIAAAAAGPRASASVSADNHGVTSSGRNRIGASVAAQNLMHMGDVWQFGAMTTNRRQHIGSFDVSMPVGYDGLRWHAAAARMAYSLPKVGASGLANQGSVGLVYPLTRGLSRNWAVTADAFGVLAEQEVNGVSASAPNHLAGLRFGLAGNAGDRPIDLGLSYWSAASALTVGRNTQHIDGVDPTDTLGSYAKLTLSGLDKFVLRDGWYVLGRANAQLGSRNLASYEAMPIGGVDGVRAYSADEGSLDDGLVVGGELRRLIRLRTGDQIAPGVWLDAAAGQVLHSVYPGWQTNLGYSNPNLSNTRWLAGWGLGLDWVNPHGMTASLTVGWKLPGSPESVVQRGSARARVLFSLGMHI